MRVEVDEIQELIDEINAIRHKAFDDVERRITKINEIFQAHTDGNYVKSKWRFNEIYENLWKAGVVWNFSKWVRKRKEQNANPKT